MKSLPKFLEKYFWDVEFEKIEFQKRRVFVLRRILEYGDEKAVAWMGKNFKRSEIKNVLSNFRGYSQKSANFWTLLLDVPREEVLCLKKRSSKEQKKIWPY
ncbi:MAG: hypothetical protein RAO92_00265 [Candidatus Euphemobacter frigidus]|nr:hypothetical protein [Candidatus Euphemobacter frigidus]